MNTASIEWRNWSGSVRARPSAVASPRTESELTALVMGAAKVRVIGAGHSFMPLCATDGTLINLSDMQGELDIAADRQSAWAPAGWSLVRLTHALWAQGLTLPNQGDINSQSLAGAISTGTHGTGAELGSLATIARTFRLLLADGSIVECSKACHPELFEAQRLSLGLLGVVLRIQIEVVPAYRLEERIELVPLATVMEQFDAIAAENRHAEFFIFPYADSAILKTLHPTSADDVFREEPASNESLFRFVCELSSTLPICTGPLQRLLTRLVQPSRRVGPAYRIFPSLRSVRFEEMEYELPRANGMRALQEIIAWIHKRKLPVAFPFEYRWVAADDIWLSPFNNGPAASLSIHQYAKMPWQSLFADAEVMLRAHGGRPHWAKRHRLTNKDLHTLYPDAARFCAVRDQVDPNAKFANPHLVDLFGIGR